jgi:hypothetical protein
MKWNSLMEHPPKLFITTGLVFPGGLAEELKTFPARMLAGRKNVGRDWNARVSVAWHKTIRT